MPFPDARDDISERLFERVFGPDSPFISREEKLNELLRLLDEDTLQPDGQSTSWHAYRVAERLNDTSLFPLLQSRLGATLDAKEKRHLYAIVAKLGARTGNRSAIEILIGRIPVEQDRLTLVWLLNGLSDQEEIPDSEPLIELVSNRRWVIRHAAIRALGKCRTPRAEDVLINVLETSQDPYDLAYANASLAQLATARAIPALRRHIHSKKDDVKASALNALSQIDDPTVVPIFLDALTDRSPAAKESAIHGLLKVGDSSAVPAVCARIRAILKRQRKVFTHPKTELMAAVEFAARFRKDPQTSPEVETTLHWVGTRWDYLTPVEKAWFSDLLPDLYVGPQARASQKPRTRRKREGPLE